MRIRLLLFVLPMALLFACGGNNKKQVSEGKSVILKPDNAPKSEVSHPGKKVYDSVCLACHMADGSGVPGMHPPITESDFVNGDPAKLIGIVLYGMKGKIEVKGEVYNSIMPPQAFLTNEQVADVLTYVRSNFGNTSGPITPDDVQKIRDAN